MKLTTKNLIIILVVLAAALAVSQLTKRSGKSKSLRSDLVVLDTAKVSKIEIASTEGNVALTSTAAGWVVDLEDGSQKRTRKDAVTNLLASLNTIEPGRLASKSPDKWKDYQVDSAGTRVRVYEGKEVATDIVLGRFGVEGQQSYYTFVRLFEDDEVYVAPNFMSITVSKDAASYRDNNVMRLQKDSLTSITFNYPDSAFRLSKGDSWFLADQPADSAAVAGYLNSLSFLTSRMFYDEPLAEDPSHTVSFSFSNQPDIVIDAYLQGGETIVRSSENKNELFTDFPLVGKVFKGRSAFLTTSR